MRDTRHTLVFRDIRPAAGRTALLAVALLIVATAFAPAPVTADTITRTFTVEATGTLTIDTDRGAIEVRSAPGNKVDVTVNRDDTDAQRLHLEFEQHGNDVVVRGDYPKDWSWFNWSGGPKIRFVATVPEGYNVQLETEGGSLTIGGAVGDVKAETSGCSVHIDQTRGDVNAETSGGSIHIERAGGKVWAKTSGGSIRVDEVMGDIQASTSGGSIAAYISQQPTANCRLHTSGGGIQVHLARNIAVDIDASTSGGRVTTDLPLTSRVSSTRSLQGRLNGGGPELSLHTSGGSVRVYGE